MQSNCQNGKHYVIYGPQKPTTRIEIGEVIQFLVEEDSPIMFQCVKLKLEQAIKENKEYKERERHSGPGQNNPYPELDPENCSHPPQRVQRSDYPDGLRNHCADCGLNWPVKE
jgi:hypothetical protein